MKLSIHRINTIFWSYITDKKFKEVKKRVKMLDIALIMLIHHLERKNRKPLQYRKKIHIMKNIFQINSTHTARLDF